jgi:tripartite-type tricarboxylate transporter receptor subunit TctC
VRRRQFIDLVALGGMAIAAAPSRAAQPYPSRPVRVVVPLAAGGNMDAMTRLITERLSAVLGQPITVDNRPGATGMIGANAVAKAEPDGHTVRFAISSVVQSIRLQKNPPYELRELAPVTQLADLPVAFGISGMLGVQELAGFVRLVKERPGKLLKRNSGMNIVHVPYKGEAPAINDLLSGQVGAVFGSAGGLSQHPGKIRMVAVTGARRLTRYPEAQTFDEAGFPLGGLTGWAGAFVPASTPAPIVERLRAEIDRIIRLPDIAARILDFGFEPMGQVTMPFATFVQDQYGRWDAAIKDASIEPE